MDGETLRSRVVQLVQRTRKAVRLYSSAERLTGGERLSAEQAEFTALQLEQWQQINTELQRQLYAAVDHPNQRLLAGEVLSIRDRFYHEWRNAESELHIKQTELLSAAEKGDFVRAAVLGRALVVVKAREQAAQAAHHELQDLVDRSRIDTKITDRTASVSPAAAKENLPVAPNNSAPTIILDKIESDLGGKSQKATQTATPQMGKIIPLRRQGA